MLNKTEQEKLLVKVGTDLAATVPAIVDTSNFAEALLLKVSLNVMAKKITAYHDDLLKPLIKALREARKRAEAHVIPLQDAEDDLDRKIRAYRSAMAMERLARQHLNMTAYEAELATPNGLVAVPVAEIPLPRTMETPAGKVQVRDLPKWEVTDMELVPKRFKVEAVKAAHVTEALRAGETIPGIRTWHEEGYAVIGASDANGSHP